MRHFLERYLAIRANAERPCWRVDADPASIHGPVAVIDLALVSERPAQAEFFFVAPCAAAGIALATRLCKMKTTTRIILLGFDAPGVMVHLDLRKIADLQSSKIEFWIESASAVPAQLRGWRINRG